MNVKEAADKTGISAHTIRYYTNQGLVPTLKHGKNGAREFDEMDLNWLLCVSFLRESGMSIADIREYFALCAEGAGALRERYDMLVNLQRKADAELARAKFRSDCIRDRVMHCRRALDGLEKDDSNPLNWLKEMSPPTFP